MPPDPIRHCDLYGPPVTVPQLDRGEYPPSIEEQVGEPDDAPVGGDRAAADD